MPLTPGTRLGPYEILALLGAGGMGEVYRANDSRLNRDVAIKILIESFATDGDRLRRFESEARAIAALDHPNIIAIHDLGSFNGTQYIVSELLQGSTLRDKLRGRLPPRRTIEYAAQLAKGLAAAHERGIIHRDLKPENIFITNNGLLKILDFGLAKQTGIPKAGADETTLASSDHTSAGVLLGTVGYMSPEQVRGEPVDPRTDIFAFGAILYEMLTGLHAFKRNSSVETMTAILKEEPSDMPGSGDSSISLGLQRVVRHCLEKDPSQRFQSAKDLTFALENLDVSSSSIQVAASLDSAGPSNSWRTATFALSVLLLIAIVFGFRIINARPSPPVFKQLTFRKGAVSAARFALDGHTIVYSAAWDNPSFKIFSSRDDGNEVHELGLVGNIQSVSRSGELAVILDNSNLARLPLNGGAPRELTDNIISADWSPDGNQLAVSRLANGRCHVEFPIGKTIYETIGFISDVRVSPRADAIAFMEHPNASDDRGIVLILDFRSKNRTISREWEGEQGLAWAPDGREILFTATSGTENERDLYAMSWSGSIRLVYRAPGGVWLNDIAADGRVLLRHEERRFEVTIGQVGGEAHLLSPMQVMELGSVSRDGRFAALTDMTGSGTPDYQIYLAPLDGSPAVLLGSGNAGGISPDNKWVTSILPSDTAKIFLLPTGIGEPKTVSAPHFTYQRVTWSSDLQTLVVIGSQAGSPVRFWVQKTDGSPPKPVTPEGIDSGLLITLDHVDYIGAYEGNGSVRLYPLDGSEPKAVAGFAQTDSLVGGSSESNTVYVMPDAPAIPRRLEKLNIVTGQRRPFAFILPADPAGLLSIGRPRITADEKRFVGTQYRQVSTLYVASGLK